MTEFSIVVPAFNSQATLAETLDSVIGQSFTDWEAIVIDDGSTDRTAQIAAEYAARDPRVRVVRQQNVGLPGARNAGLERATGEFFCPLDGDDTYLADFLKAQHGFIEDNPGYDVYSCNVDLWFPDGSRRLYLLGSEYESVVETRLDDLLERNRFTVITAVRTSALRGVGGFRSLPRLEDYDLWLRMAAGGARMLHNPQSLALYRQRPGSMSDDLGEMLTTQRDVLQHLVDTVLLPAVTQVRARGSIGRIEAKLTQLELEKRLRSGEYAGARRLFWRTRGLYSGRRSLLTDALLVMISPRAYARVVRERPTRSGRVAQ